MQSFLTVSAILADFPIPFARSTDIDSNHQAEMSSSDATLDPAALAAAQAAAEAARWMTIEAWTLYGVGIVVTFLRMFARAKAVGFRNFRADDYLAFGAAVCQQRVSRRSHYAKSLSLIPIFPDLLHHPVNLGV